MWGDPMDCRYLLATDNNVKTAAWGCSAFICYACSSQCELVLDKSRPDGNMLIVKVWQDLGECITPFDSNWYSHFQDVFDSPNRGYTQGLMHPRYADQPMPWSARRNATTATRVFEGEAVEPAPQETKRVTKAVEPVPQGKKHIMEATEVQESESKTPELEPEMQESTVKIVMVLVAYSALYLLILYLAVVVCWWAKYLLALGWSSPRTAFVQLLSMGRQVLAPWEYHAAREG